MSFLSDLLDNEEFASIPLEMEPGRGVPPGGAILAIDIGNVHTRAILLDVVDGAYRFVARGESPTTDGPPWNDVFEGVRRALDEITSATGRRMLDGKQQLIIPERDEFQGVNVFAATASAGKPIRAVLVGLVPDVSLASGKRAADSTYMQLVDTMSLADPRTEEQQIDALLDAGPDVVLIVGGTDGGAADSLRQPMRIIALATRLMDRESRPVILYAGNKDLQAEVAQYLGDEVGMSVLTAANVRPRLDTERLDSAQAKLASVYHAQKAHSTSGFAEVGSWTMDGVLPTAHGFGRMVHILSGLRDQDVLGIDLGSASTSVAASLRGSPYLNVFTNLGVGHSANELVNQIRPENVGRWLTFEPRDADELRDYLLNKSLRPHIVPADPHELEIEYAAAREIVRRAVSGARGTWRDVRQRGLLPPFGTILLTGSLLTRPPHTGWSALMALDALLPVGITRLLIDPYGLAPSLGAIAPHSPTALVQVLDAGALVDLGTVVSISGRARRGEIVLRGDLKLEGASRPEPFEVRYGTITTIPLARGIKAELTLHPRRVEIETGQTGRMTIAGGELGLIVDARGRPWRFPREANERRALMSEWQRAVTGEARA